MKTINYELVRYDAEDGKVFDWKEPHYQEDENGEEIQTHLYVKTLFLSVGDSIDNYIEVERTETDERN